MKSRESNGVFEDESELLGNQNIVKRQHTVMVHSRNGLKLESDATIDGSSIENMVRRSRSEVGWSRQE